MEDGLGASYREGFPLGYDGGARDSGGVSALYFARTCRGYNCEIMAN